VSRRETAKMEISMRSNYMSSTNRSNELPDIYQHDSLTSNFASRRSQTMMPWRPTTYQLVSSNFNETNGTMRHNSSLISPLQTRAALTELEGIRIPTVYSAARNALYTRYTPNDWLKHSMDSFRTSDTSRQMGERLRYDTMRLGNETNDKTKRTQDESSKKLGERITDTNYWKNELDNELNSVIGEAGKLGEAKAVAEKFLQETENPLHVAQECLYNREKRQGVDLVHDNVEKDLLGEIDVIKSCQYKIQGLIDKAANQLNGNRAAQHELEKDKRDKFLSLKLDESAQSLSNHSAGINFHSGVERIDNCLSIPETWAKSSDNNIKISKSEREKSKSLREEIERAINECSTEMWNQWNKVNVSLTQRIQETTDTKNKTQSHLNKVLQEIFDMEKNVDYLKKCIHDKESPLMVAETRLNTRLRRPNMELCRDPAQHRLVSEVYEIRETVEQLKARLAEAENSLQVLMRSRSILENDLSVKNNSLFIDREKCEALRKTYPMGSKLAFA
jgi:tektin-3